MAQTSSKPKTDQKTETTKASPGVNLGIALLLLAGVAATYRPILGFDFTNFDDQEYVTDNLWVQKGVTAEGLRRAFGVGYASNWHPVTWLSHMVDCELFGLNAGGHHLTNGVFHAINAVLLFTLLQGLTGARWRSAVVAGLFALHPLHVESVAWVAERKDVLSSCFGLLTLMAYGVYAKSRERREASPQPTPRSAPLGGAERKGKIWYATSLGLFALGLMSKPMLVTWPLLILLLDFWPLDRLRLETTIFSPHFWKQNRMLFLEKFPFGLLALGSSVMTFLAQRHGGAVAGLEALPLIYRIQNALLSYAGYLKKMFWPVDLAAYYPFPETMSLGKVGLAAVILAVVSGLAGIWWKRRRYFVTGWLWYLVTLLPVIGLVQVGFQAMADRYTYLSLTGPFIILVWGLEELIHKWKIRRELAIIGGSLLLAGGGFLSFRQTGYWKDSETLHRRTLAVTTRNAIAHLNLGSALVAKKQMTEAAEQFTKALEIRPNYAEARSNLGFALAALGRLDEAVKQFCLSLQSKPLAKTYFLLGNTLNMQGKAAEAIREYRHALALEPDHSGALNDLAWILATHADANLRNGEEAVRLAEHACQQVNSGEPMFLGTLAAAYAEAGRFEAAIRTGEQAQKLATRHGLDELAARNAQLVIQYRSGRAYHESNAGNGR